MTGNEWVALPDISPSDAGVGSMNIVHMASRGLVEWVGEFDEGQDRHTGPGKPFVRPFVEGITGAGGRHVRTEIVGDIEWTWLARWVPVGRCRLRTPDGHECVARITICAPVGERGGCMFALELSELKLASNAEDVRLCLGGWKVIGGSDSQHHLQKQAYARHKPRLLLNVDQFAYP